MTKYVYILPFLVVCAFGGLDKVAIEEITDGFNEMDTDGNGKLTFQEIKDHLISKTTDTNADHDERAQSIYESYDKDKDGFVTLKEFLPDHDEL